MARLSNERLDKIKKQHNVSQILSWSRISTFMTSPYSYFLKYVLRKKEDKADSIYVHTGSLAHDLLEKLYTGQMQYEDMIGEFNDGWMVMRDISQLKFDRTDEEKDNKIGNKYHDNLVHFFQHHNPIKYNVAIEKPIKILVGKNVFVGYIDCIYKDENDVYHIVDFKTSSVYKGDKAKKESGQLVLYSLGLHQLGIPWEKIKCGWAFLKYVTLSYTQKNGVVKTKDVDRSLIGESIQTNCKMWLKTFGYNEDDTDMYLKALIDSNDIGILPPEVAEKYTVDDCYTWVDLDEKLVKYWEDIIIANIRDIAARTLDYERDKNDLVFFDTPESVEKNSYYFANLSGFSANLHKPYAAFLEELERKKQQDDLFSGIGSSVDSVNSVSTSKNICDNDDDDLSWLDSL